MRHGPNMFMDVLDGTQFQGPFGMDQMSPWSFWKGQNVAKYQGLFGMDQMSYGHFG